jgi:hypothetical protein
VIDTLTRKTIATLPEMANSRQHIEIDFQDGTPIWAATSRSGIGYVNPLPPTFTARIAGPALGSTVSGSNVTVSTSVFDTAGISSVDLFIDGALFASTSGSPYTFTWDTTKDANGRHDLKVVANNTLGNTTSFVATFTVNNVGTTPNPPSITSASLSGGTQNAAYSATLVATGGTAPYSWSVTSGTLPVGLALASATGVISGTSTGTGTSTFTVKVTDANAMTATKSLSIVVSAAPSSPSITTVSLPGGTQNANYSATLAATGGTAPYGWSVPSGTLPAGLALASTTGVISGTPTGTGTSTFTMKVTDANALTATKSLSITVSASTSVSSIAATNGTPQSALMGAAFASTLKATVKDSAGIPLPGVVVTFVAPAQTGASGTFAGAVNTATTSASGVATSTAFTANGIAGGPYSVIASVTGSTASTTFSLTNVDFRIAQSVPGAVQITAGTSANVTLILTTTPTGSPLPADVNFTCAAPALMSTTTCTLNPAKILANSPSGSATTLAITTLANLPPSPKRHDPRTPYLPWPATTALAGLLAIYFAACHRIVPLRGRTAYLVLVLLVITSAGLMGCGAVSTEFTQAAPSSNITVTATSGGISRTATVSFNVK